MTCARCGRGGDTVQTRALWLTTRQFGATYLTAPLCDDCNDIVQGPDNIDVTTENTVEGDRYYVQKTGITRTYAVIDRTTGKLVDSTGTFNSAKRRAAKLNERPEWAVDEDGAPMSPVEHRYYGTDDQL